MPLQQEQTPKNRIPLTIPGWLEPFQDLLHQVGDKQKFVCLCVGNIRTVGQGGIKVIF